MDKTEFKDILKKIMNEHHLKDTEFYGIMQRIDDEYGYDGVASLITGSSSIVPVTYPNILFANGALSYNPSFDATPANNYSIQDIVLSLNVPYAYTFFHNISYTGGTNIDRQIGISDSLHYNNTDVPTTFFNPSYFAYVGLNHLLLARSGVVFGINNNVVTGTQTTAGYANTVTIRELIPGQVELNYGSGYFNCTVVPAWMFNTTFRVISMGVAYNPGTTSSSLTLNALASP